MGFQNVYHDIFEATYKNLHFKTKILVKYRGISVWFDG